MSFSWVPFYRELAGKVLEFEDRQDELIAVLREMRDAGLKVVPIEDDLSRTERVLFTEIDPFTFMATFSRSGDKTAVVLCDWIRTKWDLQTPTPTDFDGRANVAAVGGASWFFTSSEFGRAPQDIPLLWELAKTVYQGELGALSAELYEKCVMLKNVGVLKLSTGLFWFNPSEFLSLVGPTLPYLRKNGVKWDEKLLQVKPHCKLSEYVALMEKARAFNPDFVSLSHLAWVGKKNGQIVGPDEDESSVIEAIPPIENVKMPLNQILYGPPGTGKTYNSIRRAVEIIDGKIGDDPKSRFEELRKAGQIEFVTFHQSFSYEEFIEGLRPVIGEENGQVSYEIRDGILKELAVKAVSLCLEPARTNFEEFLSHFQFLLEKDGNQMFYEKGNGETYKVYYNEKHGLFSGNIVVGNRQKKASIKKERIFDLWNQRDISFEIMEPKIKSQFSEDERNLVELIWRRFSWSEQEYSRIRDEKLNENSYCVAKEFLLGVEDYQFKAKNEKFVLIIDEINRGNISKILGELITLLEEDKRIGMQNELRLTLPTSGETFALPPNLFILGTMNTSDKSLAQLDVALRRRFDFEEMAPDLSLCKKFPAQIPVLAELNHRLEWALDREHRLGHAYWMNVGSAAEFDAVFQAKILPLLLEYFPHDFATLRAVLGEKNDGFLREMKRPDGFSDGSKKYRWWFETGATDFSAFAQLKLNYGV